MQWEERFKVLVGTFRSDEGTEIINQELKEAFKFSETRKVTPQYEQSPPYTKEMDEIALDIEKLCNYNFNSFKIT